MPNLHQITWVNVVSGDGDGVRAGLITKNSFLPWEKWIFGEIFERETILLEGPHFSLKHDYGRFRVIPKAWIKGIEAEGIPGYFSPEPGKSGEHSQTNHVWVSVLIFGGVI